MSKMVYKAIQYLNHHLAELRKLKYDISTYIDAICLQDDDKENCIKNIIDIVTLLRDRTLSM